jgi:hypothetical protein
LPGDIKKRKAMTEHATRTLDRDLKEKKLKERVIPYTDKAFSQAAIEWLVATDQVRKFLGVVLSMYHLTPTFSLVANTGSRTPEV